MKKKGQISKILKIVLGLIFSSGLLIYLYYQIEISTVLSIILSFHSYIIFLLILIFACGMLFRTFRWKTLISYRTKISSGTIFKALSIGYMINNLLPAKVGELARMEYLKRKKGIGRSFLLGTIFIERVLDVLLVLIIFGFSLIFSQTGREVFIHNKWMFTIVFLVLFIFFYLMFKPNIISKLFSILPNKIRQVFEKIIKSFTESINFVKEPNLLFKVSLFSVLIWVLTLLTSFLILRGLNIRLPFYGYFFVVAVGVLGLVIPSTSGGIGVFHAVATAALVMLGVDSETALAYAIIAHAFDFFPNIIIGFLVVSIEGINIKSLYSRNQV